MIKLNYNILLIYILNKYLITFKQFNIKPIDEKKISKTSDIVNNNMIVFTFINIIELKL